MISPVEKWIKEKTQLYDNLNPETLRNRQQQQLYAIVDYARENTKFYADKLNSFTKLTDLPYTFPSDLANDPLAFLAIPQSKVARVTTLANSGTTNLKKRIFFSGSDLERTKEFFAVGMSTIVSKGEHALILISNKTENSLGSLLKESLSRIGVDTEISGAIRSVNEAVNASRNAGCLIGMPAEMLYMSQIAPDLKPKSVLLAADIVPSPIINRIRETWKCQVYVHYGHSEFGFGCAVDCQHHNGLHLRNADLIFEIIDIKTNKPAKPFEIGEIVITTLSNEAMPLIRYRTGNLSRLINTRCKCGGLLPRLSNIEGRTSNNITIANGKTINIYNLDEMLFSYPAVKGFDASLLIKNNTDILQLVIDSDEKIDEISLNEKLSLDINIEVKYDHADPFTHRRKRRINIC